MKTTLIILTLNEIEAIKRLFNKIPFDLFDEYFVVDGGSTDGTIEFFKKKGVKVLIQDKPGHGEAYKFGMRKAAGDVIVFFSGDGNEKPGDIPRMLKEIKKGCDLVIASRFMKGAKTFDAGPGRRFGNRFFTFLVNFFWGGRVTDVFNAFRAVNKKSIKRLNLESSFFDTELEMVIKAIKKGYKIKEFPTVELNRIGGKAKLQTWRDGKINLIRFLKELGVVKGFKKYLPTVLLGLIVLIGTVLRMPVINTYPMDRDELARVVPEFTFTSLISPGALFLSKASGILFAYSDFGYRLPVLVFSLAGIILIYHLGKLFFGKKEGLLAAFLLAGSLNHVGFSNQTKEYNPMVFFSILLTFLLYQIIFGKNLKKPLFIIYLLVGFFALLFGSYFCFFLIFYQLIIAFLFGFFKNRSKIADFFDAIRYSRPRFFLVGLGITAFVFFLIFVVKSINSYFGIFFISPKLSVMVNYSKNLGYFFTQDLPYSQALNGIVILGLFLSLPFSRYRRGYFLLVSIGLLDIILTNLIRFRHSAFPLYYPRYHSFLTPLYLLAASGSVGISILFLEKLASQVIKRSKFLNKPAVEKRLRVLITASVLVLFVGYNFTRMIPLARWHLVGSLNVLKTNFKDAGQYLTFRLKPGDTLVRVKNFGMDHKFNHVNRYIDRRILAGINYAIFPERTSNNNWYVPLRTGDEDPWGFSDWLVVKKIRPTLRFHAPYIWKLDYYGSLIATKKLENKASWRASSTISTKNIHFVFDGDMETIWGGPTRTDDYFVLDLGEIRLLNAVDYNFNQYFPQNFNIRLSQDGVSWQSVFTLATPGFSPHNFGKIYFKPTRARYIAINFIVDPLTFIKDVGIREIEVFEVYEKNVGIRKEDIYNAEPVKRFNFSDNLEDWFSREGVVNLRTEKGELKGLISGKKARLEVMLPGLLRDKSKINFINFTLRVTRGKYAAVGLRTRTKILWIEEIELNPDNLLHYYSLNLDDHQFPEDLKGKIEGVVFTPSDAVEAAFGLDFFSLDKRNLPGIQIKDKESPNGFSQFIPYEPDEDYIFFQLGNKLNLEKGEYTARFKIKVDAIDPLWKGKLGPVPTYRLNEYLEPTDVSINDILYVSLESTRGTFYESPARLNIRGDNFKEVNKYYEFSMRFKANGKEKLFFQAFSPRDRRYPANLFITYPEIEKLK